MMPSPSLESLVTSLMQKSSGPKNANNAPHLPATTFSSNSLLILQCCVDRLLRSPGWRRRQMGMSSRKERTAGSSQRGSGPARRFRSRNLTSWRPESRSPWSCARNPRSCARMNMARQIPTFLLRPYQAPISGLRRQVGNRMVLSPSGFLPKQGNFEASILCAQQNMPFSGICKGKVFMDMIKTKTCRQKSG